jgi:hypothetical protein
MNHEWVKQNPDSAARLIHELLLTQDEWQTIAEDMFEHVSELRAINSWMEDTTESNAKELKILDDVIKRFQELKSKYP